MQYNCYEFEINFVSEKFYGYVVNPRKLSHLKIFTIATNQCMCVYVSVCIRVHTYVMNIYIFVCVRMCTCVCTFICTCVYDICVLLI